MSKRRYLPFLLSVLVLVGVSGVACQQGEAPPADLTPITVQLKYFHQAQFAGFYAADQNGFYAEEGLAVTFLEGGPRIDLETPVLDGSAQFGVTAGEQLIYSRAEGEPLRAIGVIFRRNPLVFMTLASSNIVQPQDIVGKTVQYNATTRLVLDAMFKRLGIPPGQYTEIDAGFDLARFYSGEVQVWNAFLTNEVLTARAAGYPVNIINPDDYGIHSYADTLFARDDYLAANPDIALRFLRATLKGWAYAVKNPDKIAPMVAKFNPDADLTHETFQMLAGLPLIETGEDHLGWMDAKTWQGMYDVLYQQGVLAGPVETADLYTMEFLHQIYGE